jgi:ABC-type transport system substrate-binding protein
MDKLFGQEQERRRGEMRIGVTILTFLLVLSSSVLFAQTQSSEVLNVGLYQEGSSFDPHTATMTDIDIHVQNVYEPLVTISDVDPADFKPVLAESWKMSEDGLTYTFNLRKGVKFVDGTPFNAEAAKFNFDRILALKKGGSYSVLNIIENVTVRGEYTIEIKFKQLGPILAFIGYAQMVSPMAVRNHATKEDPWAEGWLLNHSAGTAPYRLEEWVRGVRYRLVENPNYWGKWDKHFKVIECRIIYEVDVQRLMLERGDLDVAHSLSFDALPALRKNPDVRIYENETPSSVFFLFNHLTEPIKNILVRKAMAHAWNYEAFSVLRRGLAPRSDGPCPSIMLGKGYKPPFRYDYDLKKAKEFLVKAGYPDGFTINVLSQKGDEEKKMMFDILQNDLAKIGVKCNLFEKTWVGIVETTKDKHLMSDPKNGMHLVNLYVSSSPFTPWKLIHRVYATASQMDKPSGALNFGYYSNSKVDDYISKALSSTDLKKATESWRKANDELINDYASIPTVNRVVIVGMRKDIEGYQFRPNWQPGACKYAELYRK